MPENNQSNRKPAKTKEALCRKCGKCCREKVDVEGIIFYTDSVCRFWDEETKLCTVYNKRHKVHANCADLDLAIKGGILPADCPYVSDLEDYKPPVEYWEDPELEGLISKLPEDPNVRRLPRDKL